MFVIFEKRGKYEARGKRAGLFRDCEKNCFL